MSMEWLIREFLHDLIDVDGVDPESLPRRELERRFHEWVSESVLRGLGVPDHLEAFWEVVDVFDDRGGPDVASGCPPTQPVLVRASRVRGGSYCLRKSGPRGASSRYSMQIASKAQLDMRERIKRSRLKIKEKVQAVKDAKKKHDASEGRRKSNAYNRLIRSIVAQTAHQYKHEDLWRRYRGRVAKDKERTETRRRRAREAKEREARKVEREKKKLVAVFGRDPGDEDLNLLREAVNRRNSAIQAYYDHGDRSDEFRAAVKEYDDTLSALGWEGKDARHRVFDDVRADVSKHADKVNVEKREKSHTFNSWWHHVSGGEIENLDPTSDDLWDVLFDRADYSNRHAQKIRDELNRQQPGSKRAGELIWNAASKISRASGENPEDVIRKSIREISDRDDDIDTYEADLMGRDDFDTDFDREYAEYIANRLEDEGDEVEDHENEYDEIPFVEVLADGTVVFGIGDTIKQGVSAIGQKIGQAHKAVSEGASNLLLDTSGTQASSLGSAAKAVGGSLGSAAKAVGGSLAGLTEAGEHALGKLSGGQGLFGGKPSAISKLTAPGSVARQAAEVTRDSLTRNLSSPPNPSVPGKSVLREMLGVAKEAMRPVKKSLSGTPTAQPQPKTDPSEQPAAPKRGRPALEHLSLSGGKTHHEGPLAQGVVDSIRRGHADKKKPDWWPASPAEKHRLHPQLREVHDEYMAAHGIDANGKKVGRANAIAKHLADHPNSEAFGKAGDKLRVQGQVRRRKRALEKRALEKKASASKKESKKNRQESPFGSAAQPWPSSELGFAEILGESAHFIATAEASPSNVNSFYPTKKKKKKSQMEEDGDCDCAEEEGCDCGPDDSETGTESFIYTENGEEIAA